MSSKKTLIRATLAERAYAQKIASRSVFDRLKEGELEVVPSNEIPQVLMSYMRRRKRTIGVRLNQTDMNILDDLAKKLNTPQGQIIARLVHKAIQSHGG